MKNLIAFLVLTALVVGQDATPAATTIRSSDIGRMERELEAAKFLYLKQHGWVQNPDNPGSVWLWSRVIGTREYRLETDVALNIEFALEPPTDTQPIQQ